MGERFKCVRDLRDFGLQTFLNMALPQNFPTAAEIRQKLLDRAATFQNLRDPSTETQIRNYLDAWIPSIVSAFIQLRNNYNGETEITITNPVLAGLEPVIEFRVQALFSTLGYTVATKTALGSISLTLGW